MQIYTTPPIIQDLSCPQVQINRSLWPPKSECEGFFENRDRNYMAFVNCVTEVVGQHSENQKNNRFVLSSNATSTVSSGTAMSGTTTTTI